MTPAETAGHQGLSDGFAVPHTHRRRWDFSADGIRRSIESSLVRLGLDRVDIVYLHDPDDHGEAAFREGYPALEKLRAEGVVGAIGAGDEPDRDAHPLPARDRRRRGALRRLATLLDHSALDILLPEAAARGRGVVVGGVFNSGLLIDPHPGATYDYAAVPAPVLERAVRIRDIAEGHGVPLRAAALHYPLRHPAVSAVLVGARSPEEVRDAAARFRAPVPDALWDDLRAEGLL